MVDSDQCNKKNNCLIFFVSLFIFFTCVLTIKIIVTKLCTFQLELFIILNLYSRVLLFPSTNLKVGVSYKFYTFFSEFLTLVKILTLHIRRKFREKTMATCLRNVYGKKCLFTNESYFFSFKTLQDISTGQSKRHSV